MAKQIVLTYEGKDYTLEFNAIVVKRMESEGFRLNTETPYTMVTDLFHGAFRMHHRKLPPETIDKMWKAQKQKEQLLGKLAGMYSQILADLMEDDEDSDDENPTWREV